MYLQALYRSTQELTGMRFSPMDLWLDNIVHGWREMVCVFALTPEQSTYLRFVTDCKCTRNSHSVSAIACTWPAVLISITC